MRNIIMTENGHFARRGDYPFLWIVDKRWRNCWEFVPPGQTIVFE